MILLKNNKKKENNKKALKWIWRNTKKHLWSVGIISIMDAILAITGVMLAMASKDIIDTAVGTREGSLINCGIYILAIVAVQILVSCSKSILTTYSGGKMTIHVRNYIFNVVTKRKYSEISKYHSGDLLNRITSDSEVVISSIVGVIPSIVWMIAKIISGIWALFILDKRISILVLAIGFLVPALGRLINKKYKTLHRSTQQTEGKSRSFIQECFENVVILKSFANNIPFNKKLNSFMKENFKWKMKRGAISAVAQLCLSSFFTIGYYFVLIWGANNISKGLLSYGTLTAFLQLFNQLRNPLQHVSGIMPQYYSAIASAERLMELEDGDYDKEPIDRETLEKIEEEFKYIKISNLYFSYMDEPILNDCNILFEKGKITAITGESGSGKSTLLKLLLGLYNHQSGKITVNDDIIVDSSLRGLFAYVPQGNMVLSGTIRENVSLRNENITDDEIYRALEIADIDEYVKSMPDGLDSVLKERGAGLSEGQIQRIAIARAILTDAPILLFDEATAALDEETESRLLQNIKSMSDKTILFVTHRNTSLPVCDTIFHVNNGKFEKLK